MTPEEINWLEMVKCDRCGVIIGLYRHEDGWRCPQCIWNEREHLIECAKNLLSSIDYTHVDNKEKSVVVVSRKSLDDLSKAVGRAIR